MARGRIPKKGQDHYLPAETYRMVQHFCLSYGELKQAASDIRSLRSPVIDDMPHGTGVSNPTEKEGMRLADIDRKIRVIENAIRDASPDGAKWLFLAVTQDKSYRELRCEYGCPYNHDAFWRLKRLVYWKVAQEI